MKILEETPDRLIVRFAPGWTAWGINLGLMAIALITIALFYPSGMRNSGDFVALMTGVLLLCTIVMNLTVGLHTAILHVDRPLQTLRVKRRTSLSTTTVEYSLKDVMGTCLYDYHYATLLLIRIARGGQVRPVSVPIHLHQFDPAQLEKVRRHLIPN